MAECHHARVNVNGAAMCGSCVAKDKLVDKVLPRDERQALCGLQQLEQLTLLQEELRRRVCFLTLWGQAQHAAQALVTRKKLIELIGA